MNGNEEMEAGDRKTKMKNINLKSVNFNNGGKNYICSSADWWAGKSRVNISCCKNPKLGAPLNLKLSFKI